ncbi:hypothetical protein ACJMK2_033808 [Sinanodonta woodiana]|uniref:Uncharacterized protein n=1 Tax=Sinanodonta woodiana TaxID=1069815 RepID=A0ABD3WT18_SINWO
MAGRIVAKVVNRIRDAKEKEELDLSKCDLIQVPDAVYLMMKSVTLRICDLSGNLLQKLPSKFPVRFPDITELDLGENKLTTLPDELRKIENLKVLNVSGNRIQVLPHVVYELNKLRALDAKNNVLTELDVTKLKRMLSLTEIDLQDNPLPEQLSTELLEIKVFTVLLGDSDPVGAQLEEVE